MISNYIRTPRSLSNMFTLKYNLRFPSKYENQHFGFEYSSFVLSCFFVLVVGVIGSMAFVPYSVFGQNVIDGTPGNDQLKGTISNDTIIGFDGNDQIYGLGGSDQIDGGQGNDQIYGSDGNDE